MYKLKKRTKQVSLLIHIDSVSNGKKFLTEELILPKKFLLLNDRDKI